MDNNTRRAFKGRMDAKQDVWRAIPALMGDGNGTIEVPNQPNYVYIRVGDGDLGQAFNNRCQLRDNLAIYVGYDPITDPDRRTFQVLSVRMADYAGAGNTTVPNVGPHHTTHEFGGGDDVYIDWRRLMGLRVGRPAAFVVTVDPGYIYRAGWIAIPSTNVDLTAEHTALVGTQAQYTLISLSSVGAVTHTNGTPVISPAALTIADVPTPPAGHIPLAAVRLYKVQTAIGDTPGAPDIVDLRFPTYNAASAYVTPHDILSASHGDSLAGAVVDGDTIIGNVTPKWSRLAISIPAANVRNVLGIDNGELRPSWKTALDATAAADIAGAAAAGTSLIFPHRDHVHRGIVSVNKSGGATLYGAVTLSEGANITLTQVAQDIEIAASGGGAPGGADTNIQYNDGGAAFGGDANLIWNKVAQIETIYGDLLFGDGANRTIRPMNQSVVDTPGIDLTIRGGIGNGNADPGQIYIIGAPSAWAGDGNKYGGVFIQGGSDVTGADYTGGKVVINGGDGDSGNGSGGIIEINGGSGHGSGDGGYFACQGGPALDTGNGGDLTFGGGTGGATSGNGGNAAISGGNAIGGDSDGGDVTIKPGAKNGAGIDGVTTVGDGGSTNYAQFARDGELTLVGTARVEKEFIVPLAGFTTGSAKPVETILGNYLGYAFSINDLGLFTFEVPDDWDSSSDLEIAIHWYINEAYALQSAEVRWSLIWTACKEDATEAVDGATTTTNSADVNIPATAKFLTETLIAIPAASVEQHDMIGFQVKRIALVDGTNPTAKPVVVSIECEYIANRLGIAT